MGRPAKFFRLPPAERRLLTKAAPLLVVVGLGLRMLPFGTARRLLSRLSDTPLKVRDALPVASVVWAVEAAGRRLPPYLSTCLIRALAAQVLLERRGHPALVHVGAVRGEGGKIEAHAWVESEGRVVIGDKELERYTALVALDGKDLGSR